PLAAPRPAVLGVFFLSGPTGRVVIIFAGSERQLPFITSGPAPHRPTDSRALRPLRGRLRPAAANGTEPGRPDRGAHPRASARSPSPRSPSRDRPAPRRGPQRHTRNDSRPACTPAADLSADPRLGAAAGRAETAAWLGRLPRGSPRPSASPG